MLQSGCEKAVGEHGEQVDDTGESKPAGRPKGKTGNAMTIHVLLRIVRNVCMVVNAWYMVIFIDEFE